MSGQIFERITSPCVKDVVSCDVASKSRGRIFGGIGLERDAADSQITHLRDESVGDRQIEVAKGPIQARISVELGKNALHACPAIGRGPRIFVELLTRQSLKLVT